MSTDDSLEVGEAWETQAETNPSPTKSMKPHFKWWLGALLAAAIGVVVWLNFPVSGNNISSKTVGFEVIDAQHVTLTFEVSKPKDKAATCRLQALNRNYTEIGVLEVAIPNNSKFTSRYTTEFQTAEEANAVLVERCWL